MNFWDKSHPLSIAANSQYDALVPSMGKCSTLQGELLRASSKIGYDWYNNGWGCNNWSGAVVFLRKNASVLSFKRTVEERDAFEKALNVVHDHSHGESVSITADEAERVCTVIHEFVVQNNIDNPELKLNMVDMLDLREPDARWEEDEWDEEDEDDYICES